MKFKPLKTSKLFYKKWPYKIECIQRGANRMHYDRYGGIDEWATDSIFRRNGWSIGDRNKLLEFSQKVLPFYKRDLQIRVEGSRFNIFLKDETLLEEICKELEGWIKRVYGPASQEELEFLMSNGHKKRVCDQYPKQKYRYRIYLKERMHADTRLKFFQWIEKYGDKADIAKSTHNWLLGISKYYMQNPFLYVEDGPMLSMAMLFLGDNVRIVEEFILRSSINTSLNQEKTCQPLVKA